MLETASGRAGQAPRSGRRKKAGRRHRGLNILLVLVLFLGGIAGGMGAFYSWATGASGPKSQIVVTIAHGATGAQVADLLKEKAVIRSTFAFKLFLRFRHLSGGFQAGQYHLTTNMTVDEAITALKAGPFLESVLAGFPEGLTVAQMSDRVQKELGISARDFKKLATSGKYSLAPYLPAGTKTVEGFLFPETYDFLKDATADDVINRLLAQFQTEVKNLPWANAQSLGLTEYQVVVMASIIEREAGTDADRPKIARVFYNRLKAGMPLQSDVTVQYALGPKAPQHLTFADLKVKSPYNTYLRTGLPPTPIDSPSLASIEAALNPAKGAWLYFIGVGTDCHLEFADTFQQFTQLKSKSTC